MSGTLFKTLVSLEDAYILWQSVGLRIDEPNSSRETSWRNYFASNPERFFAAYTADESLIGVAVIFFDGRKAGIYRVAVDPSHRSTGVARKLISTAEEYAKRLGAGSVYALIEDESVASATLFASEGFERLEAVRYYVKSTS